MNDADDIDIYEELEYVDLTKECEKLQAEISKLQEENGKFLSKIDTLVNEKEKLVQKNRILQKNISTLLKTAKEEIKRKDAKILELRVELTKVQAKKNVKENTITDENFKTRSLPADHRLGPDENKLHGKLKAPIDCVKFDKRLRLSEKIDENRLPRTRRDDDRYRKYPRRRSRSPAKKSKSKSPHRKRNKSPVARKRRRSRSPVVVKRRRSRTRSPKKVSKSPVATVPYLEKAPAVPVKPVDCVEATPITPTVLPRCEETEIGNKSVDQTPEEPKTGSTDRTETETISPSIGESPAFSESIPLNDSLEREDGEIVSDQCETVDAGPRKTLYTARMEQRLKLEDEEREKEMNPAESSSSPKTDDAMKTQPMEPILNNVSLVETYSPFKNNYKLVPWSPAPKKTESPLTVEQRIKFFNVDKPVKPLALADLATESEVNELQPGFDIKSYRIPKKKTADSEPAKKTEPESGFDVESDRVSKKKTVHSESAKNSEPHSGFDVESDRVSKKKTVHSESAKNSEPHSGFDGKSGRIPKKNSGSLEPGKEKGANQSDGAVVENGLDKTVVAKEAGNDIANFEFFKTMNNKNTSSSSMDLSSESRRLHNDLQLTDSDVNLEDSEATSKESSNSSSNSGASDIMELFL